MDKVFAQLAAQQSQLGAFRYDGFRTIETIRDAHAPDEMADNANLP
jgi:hypothetical protein